MPISFCCDIRSDCRRPIQLRDVSGAERLIRTCTCNLFAKSCADLCPDRTLIHATHATSRDHRFTQPVWLLVMEHCFERYQALKTINTLKVVVQTNPVSTSIFFFFFVFVVFVVAVLCFVSLSL